MILEESKVVNICPKCQRIYIPVFLTPEQQKYLNDYGDVVDTIMNIGECEDCKIKER